MGGPSDNFWEHGNYRGLLRRFEQAIAAYDDYAQLLRERATVELEYAQALGKWNAKWMRQLDRLAAHSSLQQGLVGFLRQAREEAELHVAVHDALSVYAREDIEAEKQSLYHKVFPSGYKEVKKAEKEFGAAQKAWEQIGCVVERSRRAYYAAYTEAVRIYHSNGPGDRYQRARAEEEEMQGRYEAALLLARQESTRYRADVTQAYAYCESLLLRRSMTFKGVLIKYHALLSDHAHARDTVILANLGQHVRSIDPVRDEHQWSKTYGVGMELGVPQFVPWDPTAGGAKRPGSGEMQPDTCSSNSQEDTLDSIRMTEGWLPRSTFAVLDIIGQGAFGEVAKGVVFYKGSAVVCAIKQLLQATPTATDDLLHEVEMMKRLDHPNVVRLIGVSTEEGGPDEMPALYMLMEYMDLGDLRKFVKNHGPQLSLGQRLWFCVQMARGLAYLHSLPVVHRDIAARNILLTADPSGTCVPLVKISDLGMAQQMVGDAECQVTSSEGLLPIRWMAPETLKLGGVYSTASDIWSIGVCMWEIFANGDSPYSHMGRKEFKGMLQAGNFTARLPQPSTCPEFMFCLLLSCWAHDPDNRPDAESLVMDVQRMFDTISAIAEQEHAHSSANHTSDGRPPTPSEITHRRVGVTSMSNVSSQSSDYLYGMLDDRSIEGKEIPRHPPSPFPDYTSTNQPFTFPPAPIQSKRALGSKPSKVFVATTTHPYWLQKQFYDLHQSRESPDTGKRLEPIPSDPVARALRSIRESAGGRREIREVSWTRERRLSGPMPGKIWPLPNASNGQSKPLRDNSDQSNDPEPAVAMGTEQIDQSPPTTNQATSTGNEEPTSKDTDLHESKGGSNDTADRIAKSGNGMHPARSEKDMRTKSFAKWVERFNQSGGPNDDLLTKLSSMGGTPDPACIPSMAVRMHLMRRASESMALQATTARNDWSNDIQSLPLQSTNSDLSEEALQRSWSEGYADNDPIAATFHRRAPIRRPHRLSNTASGGLN